jgi:GT2 family glycosyltransferase
MKGSILIVARNSLHLTKLAVKSALTQDIPCDVMVLNNASSDGTMQWLQSKRNVISFGNYPVQKSLSACWNLGIDAFFSSGSMDVLVINNDVEIRPDTYRALSYYGDFTTGVGVDTPLDKSSYIPIEIKDMENMWDKRRPHPDFSCFMIRPIVFEKVGLFDESYFPAYVEDSDYHVRMHRAGIEAVCVDLPFYHHACGTIKNASPIEQSMIRRGADVNREKFRRDYGCLPGSKEYEALFV